MRADTHDGPEQRSSTFRPNTFVQDRLPITKLFLQRTVGPYKGVNFDRTDHGAGASDFNDNGRRLDRATLRFARRSRQWPTSAPRMPLRKSRCGASGRWVSDCSRWNYPKAGNQRTGRKMEPVLCRSFPIFDLPLNFHPIVSSGRIASECAANSTAAERPDKMVNIRASIC